MNLNDYFNAAATVSAEDSCHLHWLYMARKICIFCFITSNSKISASFVIISFAFVQKTSVVLRIRYLFTANVHFSLEICAATTLVHACSFPFFLCSTYNSIVAHAKETIVKLLHMTFICVYVEYMIPSSSIVVSRTHCESA